MLRIRLHGVGFTYADAPIPIVSEAELCFDAGWTAVAGPNGAGKSTLLRLIAGELAPSVGRVVLEPAAARLAFVRQDVEHRSPAVLDFAESWERRAVRTRARFGLEPETLGRWSSLSPGERKRWQVAAALCAEPDVLLLDEPTNHLDEQARQALGRALSRYRGVGLLVAHDRDFVDGLAERTAWVERGRVTLYSGAYSEARAQMRESRSEGERRRAHARRTERRLETELEQRRRRRDAAERNIGARRRIKGPKDSDAREVGRKVRAASAASKHAAAQRRMEGRVARAAQTTADAHVERELGGAVRFAAALAPKATVLRAELGGLAIGSRRLIEPLTLQLGRSDRVRVSGPNGAGKSSLLRALAARWAHPDERLLYLPQELSEAERRCTLREVRALRPELRGRTLQLVAALGVDPKALLRSDEPSPGEARKLRIAAGLAREVWCVIADEPANHLDAPSIERLEEALGEFPGALLLATHDQRLAAALTHDEWRPQEWLSPEGPASPSGGGP